MCLLCSVERWRLSPHSPEEPDMTRESRFGCVCDTISCVSCVCAKYGKTTTAAIV